eukprot:6208325-Pleurochrysis_carterae.AAC.1
MYPPFFHRALLPCLPCLPHSIHFFFCPAPVSSTLLPPSPTIVPHFFLPGLCFPSRSSPQMCCTIAPICYQPAQLPTHRPARPPARRLADQASYLRTNQNLYSLTLLPALNHTPFPRLVPVFFTSLLISSPVHPACALPFVLLPRQSRCTVSGFSSSLSTYSRKANSVSQPRGLSTFPCARRAEPNSPFAWLQGHVRTHTYTPQSYLGMGEAVGLALHE